MATYLKQQLEASDALSVQRLQKLDPKIKDKALDWYYRANQRLGDRVMLRITRTYTTNADQDALYAKGRTTSGPVVTNAKGGESWHNYGRAIDFVLLIDLNGDGKYEQVSWDTYKDFDKDGKADWNEVVEVAKSLGFEWGGDWKGFVDKPHIQMPLGATIKSMQKSYPKGWTCP